MAQSSVFLNARRSQRLLQRQQFRERQAQAAIANLRAAEAVSVRGLDDARQGYQRIRQVAAETMRHRWDDSANTLLSIQQLRDLRDAERDTDAQLRQTQQTITQIEEILAAYPARLEAASAALAHETAQSLKRGRIATYCGKKLAKIILFREERALEDELIGRECAIQ